MVSIIAGLLRSIAAICRICAAGSAPPAAGLGADAGTAAGWSVTSVITGLDTAALAGICIKRHQVSIGDSNIVGVCNIQADILQ